MQHAENFVFVATRHIIPVFAFHFTQHNIRSQPLIALISQFFQTPIHTVLLRTNKHTI
jgi:hypothetical protein